LLSPLKFYLECIQSLFIGRELKNKKPRASLPTAVKGIGIIHDHRAEVTPAASFAAA
jgi:hypothetical protein